MKNDHQVYRKKRKKWMPSVSMVLTVCALLLALTGCAPAPDFEGYSVRNADRYELDIEAMNSTDTHTLELKEGDILKIHFETVKGALTMKITTPDGTALYQGDGTVTEFTVEAPVDGIYPIVVVGQKATGAIHVDVEKVSARMAEEILGSWHLAEGENDDAAVNETFPCAMDFGSSMEITGEGKISWYIGADSGTGTYTLDESHLLTGMTNDFDGTDMPIELTAEKEGDQLRLTLDYNDLTLR